MIKIPGPSFPSIDRDCSRLRHLIIEEQAARWVRLTQSQALPLAPLDGFESNLPASELHRVLYMQHDDNPADPESEWGRSATYLMGPHGGGKTAVCLHTALAHNRAAVGVAEDNGSQYPIVFLVDIAGWSPWHRDDADSIRGWLTDYICHWFGMVESQVDRLYDHGLLTAVFDGLEQIRSVYAANHFLDQLERELTDGVLPHRGRTLVTVRSDDLLFDEVVARRQGRRLVVSEWSNDQVLSLLTAHGPTGYRDWNRLVDAAGEGTGLNRCLARPSRLAALIGLGRCGNPVIGALSDNQGPGGQTRLLWSSYLDAELRRMPDDPDDDIGGRLAWVADVIPSGGSYRIDDVLSVVEDVDERFEGLKVRLTTAPFAVATLCAVVTGAVSRQLVLAAAAAAIGGVLTRNLVFNGRFDRNMRYDNRTGEGERRIRFLGDLIPAGLSLPVRSGLAIAIISFIVYQAVFTTLPGVLGRETGEIGATLVASAVAGLCFWAAGFLIASGGPFRSDGTLLISHAAAAYGRRRGMARQIVGSGAALVPPSLYLPWLALLFVGNLGPVERIVVAAVPGFLIGLAFTLTNQLVWAAALQSILLKGPDGLEHLDEQAATLRLASGEHPTPEPYPGSGTLMVRHGDRFTFRDTDLQQLVAERLPPHRLLQARPNEDAG